MRKTLNYGRAIGPLCACFLLAVSTACGAGENTTLADGLWSDTNIWSLGRSPVIGDDVTVKHAVLLPHATDRLTSFCITNATLTFTNANTVLRAVDIDICNGGILEHADINTNTAPGVTNRVHLVASNVTVYAGGSINVNAKGFRGGTATALWGQGPGGGKGDVNYGGGGGHGGRGGNGYGGSAIGGDAYAEPGSLPQPGSGGGSSFGGHGGGLVWIEADGDLEINGTITANGGNPIQNSYSGAGSGGGIYLECRAIKGTGTLSANGGSNAYSGYGGRGGGGRIAIIYDETAQADVETQPRFSLSAAMGTAGGSNFAEDGTIYLDAPLILEPVLNLAARLYFASGLTWAPDHLIVSNGHARIESPVILDVANDLSIISGGGLTITNAAGWDGRLDIGNNLLINNGELCYQYPKTNPHAFTIGGAFTLTNASSLHLLSGPTNTLSESYGGLFDLSGRDVVIPSGAVIYPYADPTNGGAICIRVRDMTVHTGGSINADAKGFRGANATDSQGAGPGGGRGDVNYGGGGGHGGRGANGYGSAAIGGNPYGQPGSMLQPGSGGGRTGGNGHGGGLVWVEADGDLEINGSITANGKPPDGSGHVYAGAGSGGGIYLECRAIKGTGTLSANGGYAHHGNGGRGGGGRIAIIYDETAQADVETQPRFSLSATMGTAGGSNFAEDGTIYLDAPLILEPVLNLAARLYFASGLTWAPDHLIVSNGHARIESPVILDVANDLSIISGGGLTITNAAGWDGRLDIGNDLLINNGTLGYYYPQTNPHAFTIGGDFTMTNASSLHLFPGSTNAGPAAYGGLFDLSGRDLVIPANSVIYPYADATNGSAICIRARNLTILTNGSINADAKGYASQVAAQGYGPGGGKGGTAYGGGGGHGGEGGDGLSGMTGGDTNGVEYLPLETGSAGGGTSGGTGGAGGGLVWLEVVNTVDISGSISANGGNTVGSYGGGGAGGGMVIQCRHFSVDGTIRANGGSSSGSNWGGRGGGGRIAILLLDKYTMEQIRGGRKRCYVADPPEAFRSFFSVTNGTGVGIGGLPGTAKFVTADPSSMVFIIR